MRAQSSLLLGLIVLTLGCGIRTRSPAINRIAGEHEVRAAEQLRFDAMMKQDVAVLDSLLDEDLTYVHADGELQSKEELIEMIRSRRLVYESIEPSDVHVHVYQQNSAAIATGLSQMRLRSATGVSSFRIRFTEAYIRKGGRWLLAAWQATRVAT